MPALRGRFFFFFCIVRAVRGAPKKTVNPGWRRGSCSPERMLRIAALQQRWGSTRRILLPQSALPHLFRPTWSFTFLTLLRLLKKNVNTLRFVALWHILAIRCSVSCQTCRQPLVGFSPAQLLGRICEFVCLQKGIYADFSIYWYFSSSNYWLLTSYRICALKYCSSWPQMEALLHSVKKSKKASSKNDMELKLHM